MAEKYSHTTRNYPAGGYNEIIVGCKMERMCSWQETSYAILKGGPEMKFVITDFGAKTGDRLQTEAIQKAIDTCYLQGGGEVVIPAGIYRTGGLLLRSHVTLHLMSGAVLEASEDPDDYDAVETDRLQEYHEEDFCTGNGARSSHPFSRWQHGIIRAMKAEDIAVIGEPYSFIDGRNCYDPEGEENYRGPHGLNLWNCSGVTLKGYTLRNTGNWAHALFFCQDILAQQVTVYGGHDAFDVFLCENVKVAECGFYTGDDCIAGFGSRNVHVSDCILHSACSVFRFGGADVVMERCISESPCEFAFRGSLTRQQKEKGRMPDENARRNTLTAFLYYCDDRFADEPIPRMGNILIRDCEFSGVDQLFNMDFGRHRWCCHRPLTSITFENCCLTGAISPIYIHGDPEDPITFTLKNMTISPAPGHEKDDFMDAENYRMIRLDGVDASGYEKARIMVRSRGDLEITRCLETEVTEGESGKSGYSGH